MICQQLNRLVVELTEVKVMGITLSVVEDILSKSGLHTDSGLKILDIGCQNLYSVSCEQVVSFLNKWKPSCPPEKVKKYAEMVAEGSEIDPVVGGINGAWLGDLLTKAGFDYISYDIFDGYKTFVFDLNFESVPKEHLNAFDLVLNCGTSEHVLGQYNCFKVMHDAVRVGGFIYHDLPFTGYLDHGYFNYQPKMFFDLAKANAYEIVEVSVGEPLETEDVVNHVIDFYQKQGVNIGSKDGGWKSSLVPTGGISILLRKVSSAPFKVALETSTTAGPVKRAVQDYYKKGKKWSVWRKYADKGEAVEDFQRAMLRRLNDPELSYGELMAFYHSFISAYPDKEFPLELEKKSLTLALENWPDRSDMQERLLLVEQLILQKYPLLDYVEKLPHIEVTRTTKELDSFYQRIGELHSGAEKSKNIIAYFKTYFENGMIREFPVDIEIEAIKYVMHEFGATPFLKIRLGHLLSGAIRAFRL